jgi:hypothetical protein
MKGFAILLCSGVLLAQQGFTAVDSPALQTARPPVEAWLGRAVAVYDGPAPEAAEAVVTADAVWVSKDQFKAFRSSFELAEFLTHVAAHVRLGHVNLAAQPAKARAEMEKAATELAEEILPTTDCGPGPCDRFGRLLAAARK